MKSSTLTLTLTQPIQHSTTVNETQYQSILSQLSSMTPLEAIKLAEYINSTNGFSFISPVRIAGWKREVEKNKRIKNEMQKGYMQLLSYA